jgi:hypothetical protein
MSVLGLSKSEHLVYDPSGVHKEYPSDEFSEPIVFGKYSALGVSLQTQIERRGVLFVFTKAKTPTPSP